MPYLPPPVPELPDHLVRGAMVLSSRDALVHLLPKGKVLGEIGVALGYFTNVALMVAKPSRYIAIDAFELHKLPSFWGKPPTEHFGALSHLEWFRRTYAQEIAAGRMDVLKGDSASVLAALPDHSIDIAYVDADHTYAPVKRDLDVLVRKIRPDGWIMMDDYTLVDQMQAEHLIGVIYATHEFMIAHGWAMHYLALQTNGYYQVVLRRADQPRPADPRVAALEHEIALLRASTSWRATAPLRRLRRMFPAG